uniref:Uncharacterized protein n=1 Tax=Siphoviridae sp. ctoRD1 TaxID=2825669 RepID=A0A8S5QDZ1_9CAUD|nr:MAG TPA: hypothetical protein [Siphoviridae sp. ctoRD1]
MGKTRPIGRVFILPFQHPRRERRGPRARGVAREIKA